MKFTLPLLFFSVLLCSAILVQARVSSVQIDSVRLVLDGKTFGDAGAYQVSKGKVYFQFDPFNTFNTNITDIKLAPRNANGMVEAYGDLVVLQPVDAAKGRGTALVEVSNRGRKYSPSYFNAASKSNELEPDDPDYWGDGLLLQQGYTVIWIGWQFDVADDPDLLKLKVPFAKNVDGTAIEGLVRSDWTVDKKTTSLGVWHRSQVPYPAIDLHSDEHQLTVREGRESKRYLIDKSLWRFATKEQGRFVENNTKIYLEPHFEAGKIYELVYKAKDPPVVGLGLLAIRDIVSYAKYDPACSFQVKRGIATGASQTGRFLRHFLYQGFNTDESGRKAFDAMLIFTAGAGRGSFNHRFAQPSRDGHRYSAFFYPSDLFPFTSRPQKEPDTDRTDGLLSHLHNENHKPLIFYINTGYEYWGRAASLIHTSPDGKKDIQPYEHERIYQISSAQHYESFLPSDRSLSSKAPVFRGNPMGFKFNYRALLLALTNWLEDGAAPPPSSYPSFEKGTLVSKDGLAFPELPGVKAPSTIHVAYKADYGPNWDQGVIDIQPPRIKYTFQSRVSQVNKLGNEIGGVQNVELAVPLATYTPWNLRKGYKGGAHEILDFRGTFIPFPKTEKERSERNDPRPSIASLYSSKEDFLKKVEAAAKDLVQQGFLLEVDVPRVKDRNAAYWDWIMKIGE